MIAATIEVLLKKRKNCLKSFSFVYIDAYLQAMVICGNMKKLQTEHESFSFREFFIHNFLKILLDEWKGKLRIGY